MVFVARDISREIAMRNYISWLSAHNGRVPKDLTPPNYPYIDGLRGLAILMVMVRHLRDLTFGGALWAFPKTEALLGAGERGVQLFFLVSAFTLYSSSLARQYEPNFVRNFYLRRFFRILPLWWIAVLLYQIHRPASLLVLLSHLTMTFGFIPHHYWALLPQSWSIFVEESFYLFFPLWFLRLRSVPHAFLGLILTYLMSSLWLRLASPMGIPAVDGFHEHFAVNQWFCFFVGILLFQFYRSLTFQKIQNQPQWNGIFFLGSVVLLSETLTKSHAQATLGLSLFLLTVALPYNPFGWLLRRKVFLLFGRYCYSIYLFHLLVLQRLNPHFLRAFPELPAELRFVLFFAIFSGLCFLVGQLSFELLERRFMRLGKSVISFLSLGAIEVQQGKGIDKYYQMLYRTCVWVRRKRAL